MEVECEGRGFGLRSREVGHGGRVRGGGAVGVLWDCDGLGRGRGRGGVCEGIHVPDGGVQDCVRAQSSCGECGEDGGEAGADVSAALLQPLHLGLLPAAGVAAPRHGLQFPLGHGAGFVPSQRHPLGHPEEGRGG